jgi:hypothetical protein
METEQKVVDVVCRALLKEYMKRKGYEKTYQTFSEEEVRASLGFIE